jgi:demethylmenaquinone methyltransferase/2-methoxy-6-polyprenyl-1,4-benzoquinol methylase
MFGAIAGRYDFLNHFLSLNLDRRWRRHAAEALAPAPADRVLDLCGGTGDLSVEIAGASDDGPVVCCDFSHPMLERARKKFGRLGLADRCGVVEADGLRLPFASESFDGVAVGFGVRNLADLDTGFREMGRVLRPSGRLVVLEFSAPTGRFLGPLYRFYLHRVLPRLGDRVAGRAGPYRYLANTIAEFPAPPALAGRIREAGFSAVGWTILSGGIVAVHRAIK